MILRGQGVKLVIEVATLTAGLAIYILYCIFCKTKGWLHTIAQKWREVHERDRNKRFAQDL